MSTTDKLSNYKILKLRNNRELYFDKTKIMGILNITPNSFSDGDLYLDSQNAINHAVKMIKDGVDIIDIGGESSRPGSDPVDELTELSRILPVIESIRMFSSIPISVDTYHAHTAEKAIIAGADIINDISALSFDSEMIDILKKYSDIPVILMHMKGNPKNMQENPYYDNVIDEIINFFEERILFCQDNGINRDRIVLDPGIGFGKRLEDNLKIINNLKEFKSFKLPILLGASRKSFINQIYTSEPSDRLEGTLASSAYAVLADIEVIRVHDVKENLRFVKTMNMIKGQL